MKHTVVSPHVNRNIKNNMILKYCTKIITIKSKRCKERKRKWKGTEGIIHVEIFANSSVVQNRF